MMLDTRCLVLRDHRYFGALKRQTSGGVFVNRSYHSERRTTSTSLTMSLHDTQEFYNNLGGRPDEDLALASSLGINNVVLKEVKL
jgi:hypothetical protein